MAGEPLNYRPEARLGARDGQKGRLWMIVVASIIWALVLIGVGSYLRMEVLPLYR